MDDTRYTPRPGGEGPSLHYDLRTRPARVEPERPLPACNGEQELALRLAANHMPRRHDYTTGEVANLLGICRETVRQMTLRWEPHDIPGRHPTGLFAIKLGRKRRIPHSALVEWLEANSAYDRETW